MNTTLLFSLLLAAILFWIFLVSKLREKPWLDKSVAAPDKFVTYSSKQLGLWVFMAVATSLFLLFMIIYAERSTFPDWVRVSDPDILWFNTAVLILSSVVLQKAHTTQGNPALQTKLLWIGFGLTTLFLVGQFYAWRLLNGAGIYLGSNPANAFFYLFTLLHALHLIGGMFVLGKALVKAKSKDKLVQDAGMALSIKLCTTYWHFLLILWLALFYFLITT